MDINMQIERIKSEYKIKLSELEILRKECSLLELERRELATKRTKICDEIEDMGYEIDYIADNMASAEKKFVNKKKNGVLFFTTLIEILLAATIFRIPAFNEVNIGYYLLNLLISSGLFGSVGIILVDYVLKNERVNAEFRSKFRRTNDYISKKNEIENKEKIIFDLKKTLLSSTRISEIEVKLIALNNQIVNKQQELEMLKEELFAIIFENHDEKIGEYSEEAEKVYQPLIRSRKKEVN